ncbi:OB-fold nucleic acid binding domain-containing protein [Thermococcus alcaliphilus]|uniref:OB-fold nucleic acid binding domain-containing protein n=1 Tax=Thermococcus alcaliphilus TaxID=139207 RepID=UPI002090D4B7|nr:OB-fold nucleic acid binding domain-containing protein [Thermococcus alcaliphilus]MCO6041390.1 OB-fold nucleic acid binding domain-containing protein [Thermococcus alcaliphilus]
MTVITKEEIVDRIRKKTGMSLKEIERKIKEIAQTNEISEHAAALLLAEQLGVETEEEEPALIHIADLVPGMRNINVVGRVLRKYPVREYTKRDGSTGRVAALLIYDNTGRARVVLWDSEIAKYYNEIQPGTVIKIINADVRESLRGLPELHVNFRSRVIINPEDPRVKEIPPIEEVRSYNYTRKNIGDLMGGEKFVEVRGTIAKLYRVIAYDACPQCRRKVDYDPATETWVCIEHGEVKPIKATILDFGLDDSTGYIRVTLFGDDVVEILGAEPEDISEKLKELVNTGLTMREAGRKLAEEEFYHVLGKEIIVRGNVVEDRFLGLILKASSWDEVEYEREIERVRRELLKEVE